MQKMCDEKEMGGEQCNNEVLTMLKKMEDDIANQANPLWKGLDSIKGLE
jgi:aryl carrier-like protein